MLSGSALLVWAMENASKKKVLQSVSAFIPDNSRNLFFQKVFSEKKGEKFTKLYPPRLFFEEKAIHFAGEEKTGCAHGAFPHLLREEIGLVEEKFKEWFHPLDKEELLARIENAGVGVDLFSFWREVVLYTTLSNQSKKERIEKCLKSLIQRHQQRSRKEERFQCLNNKIPLLGKEIPLGVTGKNTKIRDWLYKLTLVHIENWKRIYGFVVAETPTKALCRVSYEKEEYVYVPKDLLEEIEEIRLPPPPEVGVNLKNFFPETFLEKYVLASIKENLAVKNEGWLADPFPLIWGFYTPEKLDFEAPLSFQDQLVCVLAPREMIVELKQWLGEEGIHVPLYALEEE